MISCIINSDKENNTIFWRKTMEIKKKYIGTYEGIHGEIEYYMLQKGDYYGVEILEGKKPNLESTIEWFSEDPVHALTFVQLLYKHGASSVHLSELIDNDIK